MAEAEHADQRIPRGANQPVPASLVEAGVRFVTIHHAACGGDRWDSHRGSRDVKNHRLPALDQSQIGTVT